MDIAKKNLGCRLVVSGNKIEFYEYEKPIYIDYDRKHTITKKKTEESCKREDNLFRARQSVRRIIWANLEPHSKFLTLTYANTQLDIEVFERHFTTFLQNMKRHGYKLRYLCVIERQKKRGKKEGNIGTVHPHVVVFNDEYIPFELITKCWGKGNIDIHMIDGLREENGEKVKDVGAYVCKYLTKDAELEWGSRSFRCSKGLKRPQEFKVYAYGEIDKRGLPNYVCENMEFYDFIKNSSDITYRNKSYFGYQLKDGTQYTNSVNYYQANKSCNLIIQDNEVFEEIE